MSTGEMLKQARKRNGMTLTALADAIGSSAATLSELENGVRKSPASPEEVVAYSSALHDPRLALEYCDTCPLRKVIVPRKFPEMNNLQQGAIVAAVKMAEKSAKLADKLRAMMIKMTDSRFKDDPEFGEFRDDVYLLILDEMRGLEIMKQQLMVDGFITIEDHDRLVRTQQLMCEAKGHHREG